MLHRSYKIDHNKPTINLNLKAHANGRNKCQQLPTLMGVVGQQCCVHLHGPKSLTGFKLYATSANIVVVPCKQCWVLLVDNVGSVCMGLKAVCTQALFCCMFEKLFITFQAPTRKPKSRFKWKLVPDYLYSNDYFG